LSGLYFTIADVAIELIPEAGLELEAPPSLLPFVHTESTNGTLCAGDSATATDRIRLQITVGGCEVPRDRPALFDSACHWRVYRSGTGWQFLLQLSELLDRPYKSATLSHDFSIGEVRIAPELAASPTGRYPLEFPLDELLLGHYLSTRGGVELHASACIDASGEALLMIGQSGAGKSTTARLLRDCARHLQLQGTNATTELCMLSDDRVFLRPAANRYTAFGTPWHGEARFASPRRAPVRALLLLEQAKVNSLTRLSAAEATAHLASASFPPMHALELTQTYLDNLATLAITVPCYRLALRPSPEAVELLRQQGLLHLSGPQLPQSFQLPSRLPLVDGSS
jgi:hypothetical protein